MAAKNRAPDEQIQTDDASPAPSSVDILKERIARLQAELESERKLVKQLRREKSYELQKTRELEQTKASIALKELRGKLHQERVRELELQKESLARRYDLDLQTVARQRDAELTRLRADLRRREDELEEARERLTNQNKCGLSGTSARGAFDDEHRKLLSDVRELRSARRHLEAELRGAAEAERRRSREVQELRSQLKADVAKVKREADTEIRRLLEELKSKDRLSWQKLKDSATQTDHSAANRLLMETPPLSPETAEPTNGGDDQPTGTASTDRKVKDGTPPESRIPVKKDPGGAIQKKVKDLSSRISELEEENSSLLEDKTQLQQKIKDMEKKHRTTLEKNKRFLEKNIEVTNINRTLEEKIKKLNDELSKLRNQSEKYKKEQSKLSEQLSSEKVDKKMLSELRCELDEMREQAEQQEKTIRALRMACNEKDMRIELLVQRHRKQKNSKIQQKTVRFILPAKVQFVANGVKETYFGYDEDTMSIDSEMSSASCVSSSRLSLDTSNDDDEVFDEVTRSDLEQSYQRLTKEHLELEKSYALLQAKVGVTHTDPQREYKDMGWLEEKEILTKTIRILKDKIKSQETHEKRMTHRISEIQEENEELEFRILELEELNEKLKEDINDTITIKEPPKMTDDGVLQMYTEEKGLMEIKLETVKEKLHDLSHSKDGQLEKADKFVLLQARAMLGIADKKLKDLTTTQELLKGRIKKLEAEKAELLSAATGVSTDLILEYEETRKKLEEAEQKIKELEKSMDKYKETEAVYKYTEEQNQRIETRYKEEISNLQRQLSNSQEGRQYESELWHEKLEAIKTYERKIKELETQIEPLQERVELLQMENDHLQCGLTKLQCENSRLQCENTQLHSEKTQLSQADPSECVLKSKISEYEEAIKKQRMAEDEIKMYKEKLDAAQECKEMLSSKNAGLVKELEDARSRCCHLENELETAKGELVKELKTTGHKESDDLNLCSGLQVLIKQVRTLLEEKETLQEAAEERSAENGKLLKQLEEKMAELEDLQQKVREYDKMWRELDQVQASAANQSEVTKNEELLEEKNRQKDDRKKLEEEKGKMKEDKRKLEEDNKKLEEDKSKLKEENKRLREELEKSQKNAENEIIQLNSQSRTLIEKVKSLEVKLKESRDEELQMKDRIALMEEEKSRYIQHLQSQLDQMEESEAQLYQTINELKVKESALKEEIGLKEQQLRDKMAAMEQLKEENAAMMSDKVKLQEKVNCLERRETEQLETVQHLEEANRTLKENLEQIQMAGNRMALEQKQTVELSVNTEDDLLAVEEQLKKEMDGKKKLIEDYQTRISGYEKERQRLEEKLNEANGCIKILKTEQEKKDQVVKELADSEKDARMKVNELEKSEMLLRVELDHARERVSDKERAESELRKELDQSRSGQDELRSKVSELEANDVVLRSKLAGLESLKKDLLETVQKSAHHAQECSDGPSTTSSQSQGQLSKDNPSQKANRSVEDLFLSSADIDDLQNMPREEMIARIRELEEMQASHLKKIKELSENLSSFRQAVEVVAVTLETDSNIPSQSSKPKLRDQDLDQRIRQLCKSELILNLKYLEQGKREALLRLQLHEAETTLKRQTKEYRAAIQELEEELDHVRKNEARCQLSEVAGDFCTLPWAYRLKNKLQYGGWNADNHSLAKIQHLEELVFELEANERKLKRQLQESQDNEDDLKQRLSATEEIHQNEDVDELLRLPAEESARIALPGRLHRTRDASELHKYISDMEEAEKHLRMKLDQLMVQEASGNFEEDQPPILSERPETVLRQRVQELEVMHRILKHQVVELEHERRELDEITRKDKGCIHDLNVKIMKLEQMEANLKDQLSKMESTNRNLNLKMDDLDDEIKRLQTAEKQLKVQLVKAESAEATVSMQLEHTKEDMERNEAKLKQKIAELEKERKQLVHKSDELADELGDLHGVEIMLKQKLRNLENTEVTLRNKNAELEDALKAARRRAEELESCNETLSQKIHKLEEEKSSIMFEMSDLVVINNKNSEELQEHLKQLQNENKQLKNVPVCGHEEEITRLHKEISKLCHLSKAHEVLKSNHEDAKQQLKDMEKRLNQANTKCLQKTNTKSKSIQVKLTDSYSIHDLQPANCFCCLEHEEEFKTALKNLGAHHPVAYHAFVKALQPCPGRRCSVVRATGLTDSPTASPGSPPSPPSDPHHPGTRPEMSRPAISEGLVMAEQRARQRLVPQGTVSAKGGQKKGETKKYQRIDPSLRKHDIGRLVDALLLADTQVSDEDAYWQVVETVDSEDDEKPYWAEVEVRPVDVMTLSIDVWGLTTDESSSEASSAPCHQNNMPSEAPSVESSVAAPPLPKSVPPRTQPRPSSAESYYLPNNGCDRDGDDSADEAPDIVDEDDGLTPLKAGPRAKSVERDSDFSERSLQESRLHRHKKRQQRLAGSLESIQDSGIGSLNEDHVIKSMKERIAELEAKLQDSKNESSNLMSKDILVSDCTSLKNDNIHLKSLLEERTKELTAKTNEILRLTEKLKHIEAELSSAQDEKASDKKSLRTAEDKLNRLKEVEKSLTDLQSQYTELNTEHEELKEKFLALKEASEEVVSKKQLITELQSKLSSYNKLTLELQSSEKKVKALEDKLKDMAQTETMLTHQNVKLLHDVDSLRQLLENYHTLEGQYNKIRSKFDEALQVRSKALAMIAPLRAKVIRFANKCKSKDEVIRHLSSEMRRCGRHNDLAVRAEHVTDTLSNEDYDRPISPVTMETVNKFEKDLKDRPLDFATDFKFNSPQVQSCKNKPSGLPPQSEELHHRDIEALLDHKIARDDDQVRNESQIGSSQSAEDLHKSSTSSGGVLDIPPQSSQTPITQLKIAKDYLPSPSPPTSDRVGRCRDRPLEDSIPVEPRTFVAVNDYNPELFSTSGQKHLELPLHEGDLVKVLGSENERGYYTAEVKGRVGLVPALYLIPSTSHEVPPPEMKQFQPPSEVVNSSPEQILTMYAELAKSHEPKYSVLPDGQSPEANTHSRRPSGSETSALVHPAFTKSATISSKAPLSPSSVIHPAFHRSNQSRNASTPNSIPPACPPDPPSDFHIQRIVGDHSVLLSWIPPVMDELARSNGITVKGYKIYINSRDVQFIPSAHMSKAFIEKLNFHHGRTTFSIQTIGENGRSSQRVEAIAVDELSGDPLTEADCSQEKDTFSLKSAKQNDNGEKKRLCFALYDYDPSKHSANPFPTQELALKTGDVLVTYGREREDGFYHGKVHGKKGLIPASFIEEVPVFTYKNRRSTSSNGSHISSLLSRSPSDAGSSHGSIATSERSRPPSNHSNHSTSSNTSRLRLSRKFKPVV